MFRLGTGELIMLAVIVFIVFSASRMSQLGENLGRFVNSFRKASQGPPTIDVTPGRRLERGTDEAEVVPPRTPPPSV